MRYAAGESAAERQPYARQCLGLLLA